MVMLKYLLGKLITQHYLSTCMSQYSDTKTKDQGWMM